MIKDEKELHWHIIELIAHWQGKVNSTHLIKHFNISRKQGGDYLRAYNEAHPNHLIYNKSLKGFLPSFEFEYKYINGDVTQYLDWLSSLSVSVADPSISFAPMTYTSLRLPGRQVSPLVMRGLVNAINKKCRIDVNYVSLTNPNGEGRVIQPHIFIKTGLRWHLRAYDEKRRAYRDFVLSRFRGVPELLSEATHCGQKDKAWNTNVNLILEPDSRLTQAQKAVLEHDYQMNNSQLVIETRAALVHYLLQEMQVNFKFLDKSPEAQ